MRSAPLLLLAACSASARAPVAPAAARETVVEPDVAPVAAAPAAPAPAAQHVTVEAADDAASVKPVRTYALPASTTAFLAREKVRGQVLVAGPLFPTDAAARGMVSTIDDAAQPVAMKVVADRGKVVQVTTTAAADCVPSPTQSYELTVYVPRNALVPRTTEPIAKQLADGTAFAIDRGAPVRVTAAGAAWFDALLDQTSATPPERLAYSLTRPYAPAVVPGTAGDRLVCDGAPMTKTEWTRRRDEQALREAAKTNAALKKVAVARAQSKSDAVDGLVDLVVNDGATLKAAPEELPYCKVALEGRATDKVFRAGDAIVAELPATCARVRVAVDGTKVRAPEGEVAAKGTVKKQKAWIPKAGPVFWPDGKKAGRYTGKGERFTRVTERENLICVDVRGIASEVCHRAADVTVEK
jgi:hypothetical protein